MIVLLFIFIGLVLKIISMFRKEYHAGKLAFDTSPIAFSIFLSSSPVTGGTLKLIIFPTL